MASLAPSQRNALVCNSAGNLVETNSSNLETLTTGDVVVNSVSNLSYNYQLAASTPVEPFTPEPGTLALLTDAVLASLWI